MADQLDQMQTGWRIVPDDLQAEERQRKFQWRIGITQHITCDDIGTGNADQGQFADAIDNRHQNHGDTDTRLQPRMHTRVKKIIMTA